ncbi:MAG: NUDIX hydrolase [Pygmaiobacter sp.]|nr:NUDIX hydrolase [Pygmaiobacter sp.]
MKAPPEVTAFVPGCEQEEKDRQAMLDYCAVFDSPLLTRDNPFAHFTSSGLILNPQRTKTLMVYHNIYHSWSWTGGHNDGDADFLAVALREAKEETGLTEVRALAKQPLSLDVLPVWGHFKRGAYVAPHMHLSVAYVFVATENQPLHSKPDENSGVQWIELSQLATTCGEAQMLPVYEKLIWRAMATD